MFTGIIQAQGEVSALQGSRLVIRVADLAIADWEMGESVSVNGVCLTVVSFGDALAFDLSHETLERSNLGSLQPGDTVNMERAMTLGARLGGHIVQGHVDARSRIIAIEPVDESTIFRFELPADGGRYLVDKGSIALDGISLTVVRPDRNQFEAWIIPHTLANTNLGHRAIGDFVNVEYDILAKHVEQLLAYR